MILAAGLIAAAAALATMSARNTTPLTAPAQAAPPPTSRADAVPEIDIGTPAWFDPAEPDRTEPPED